MKNKEIIRLRTSLSRYSQALTTPAEERGMRRLLLDPALPEEFAADREMLLHLDALCPPEGFEVRLAAKIDLLAAGSAGAAESRRADNGRKRGWILSRWSVAASVAVLLSLGIAFGVGRSHTETPGSDLTPEETYAEVHKALSLFATTVDLGCSEAYKAEQTVESVTAKALASLSGISSVSNESNDQI